MTMNTKLARRAAIEALEPRTLLANYVGTSGDDEIRIYVSNLLTRVTINGVMHEEITRSTTVAASGGNDTIYLDRIVGDGIENFSLQLSLDTGTGDDLIKLGNADRTNYDTGPYFNFGLVAGAGNDSLEMDMFDSATPGSWLFSGSTNSQRWISFLGAQANYEDDLENCRIDGSNTAVDHFSIFTKRPSLRLTASGMGGDDDFRVGGGNLETSGVLNSSTLFGGAGNDDISLDDFGAAPGGTYTLSEFAIAKGVNTLVYSAFDHQTLVTARGNGSSGVTNMVNINAVSSFIDTTTIIAGSGSATHPVNNINVGNGDFNTIAGSFDLRLGPGGGSININDQSNTTGRTYTIGASGLIAPRLITYTNCDALTLNCSSANDSVTVFSSALDTALTVNAGGGSDTVSVGGGSFDNFASAVTVTGGAGTDSLIVSTILENTLATQTLTAIGFTDGLTHNYSGFEQLTLNEGSGGTNLAVNSIGIPVTVNGGAGKDHINIGTGNYSANILASLTFNAGGGDDSIIYNDASPRTGQSYSFLNSNAFTKAAPAGAVVTNSVEHKTLEAGAGSDLITVTLGSQDLRIHANAGNDLVDVVGMNTGTCTVNTGPETTTAGDALTVRSGATAIIDEPDTVGSMTINSSGALRIAPGGVLNKAVGTFTLAGKIDLAGGAMIFRGSSPTQSSIRTWIRRGYNAGAWNGNSTQGAINSSLAANSPLPDAVGYGLGSEIAPSAIGPFTIAPGDTLLRYTYCGDADLNGAVNFDDYSRTDAGFNLHRTGWVNGDFDYNDVINFDDYALIDLAFNTQGPPLRPRDPLVRQIIPD